MKALKTLGVYLSPDLDPSRYNDKLKQIDDFAEMIKTVPHSQGQFLLLRQCGPFSRAVYWMRTCPPSEIDHFLSSLSELSRSSIRSLLLPYSINDPQLRQAQIKHSVGGLGLRDPHHHHPAAQISCILQVYPLVLSVLSKFYPNDKARVPLLDSQLSTARALFDSRVSASNKIRGPPSLLKASEHTQKKLSKKIDLSSMQTLRQSFSTDNSNLSRLSECATKHSGDFLSAPLGFLGTHKMSSNHFRVALLHRLGFQFAPPGQPCKHNNTHARPQRAEPLCRHWLTCKVKGGPIKRHESLKYYVGGVALNAGIAVKYEELNLADRAVHGNIRPGDATFPEFKNGVHTLVDVTYSDPLSPAVISRNAIKGGVSTVVRGDAKIAKYREAVKPKEFIPFAVSLYGVLGPQALTLVDALAHRIAIMRELDKAQVADQIFIGISCVTYTHIASAILSHSPHVHDDSLFDVLPLGGD